MAIRERERLAGFFDGLTPTARRLVAGYIESTPTDLPREEILELLRPTLRTAPHPRARRLWRAVCCAAEHLFTSVPSQHGGRHWDMPRGLIRAIGEVIAETEYWPTVDRAYAGLDSASPRLQLVAAVQQLVAADIRRRFVELVPPLAQAARLPMIDTERLLRRFTQLLLLHGPATAVLRTVFAVTETQLDAAPLLPISARRRAKMTPERAQRLHKMLPTVVSLDEVPLLLSQIGAWLQRPTDLLLIATEHQRQQASDRLERGPLGGLVDYLVARQERLIADGERSLARWFALPVNDPEFAVAATQARENLIAYDEEDRGFSALIRLSSTSANHLRLLSARAGLAQRIAQSGLPTATVHFTAGSFLPDPDPEVRPPTPREPVRGSELALANLTATMWRVAEYNGQRMAAVAHRAKLTEMLSEHANRIDPVAFPMPEMMSPLTPVLLHAVCILARLGMSAQIDTLRQRLPDVWQVTLGRGVCLTGQNPCCKLLRERIGMAP